MRKAQGDMQKVAADADLLMLAGRNWSEEADTLSKAML
jgi:hypothetical protein